jgi:hypothetical protein
VAKHCGARRAVVPRSGTKAGEAPSVSPVLDCFVSFVPSCETGLEKFEMGHYHILRSFAPCAFVRNLPGMDMGKLAFLMTAAGTVCWGVCFWWMYRISAKQNHLLDKLGEQGRRIEKLSRMEHDLIKEVHPQVSEIKEGMTEMIAAVKENTEEQARKAGR